MKLTSIFRVVSTLLPIMLVAAGCGSDEKPPPMSPSRPSGTQLPGCSSNKDCRFDRVCTAGKCVVPPLSEETKSKIGDGELTVPVVRAIVQTRSCAGLTLRAIHQKLADLDSRDARPRLPPSLPKRDRSKSRESPTACGLLSLVRSHPCARTRAFCGNFPTWSTERLPTSLRKRSTRRSRPWIVRRVRWSR